MMDTDFMFDYLLQTALAILAIQLLRLARSYYQWYTTPLNTLPGPANTSFLLGHFLEIMREPFMEPHKRWWAAAMSNHKDVDMLHYTSLFGKSTVVLLNADIVKQVLTASASQSPVRFPKKLAILRTILGDSLVTLDGTVWSRHRRIIQPSFNTGFLREKLNASVPSKVQVLISYWAKANGREIDIAAHMSALTLDVIGDVAFSHDFHALDVVQQWAIDEGSDQLATVSDRLITSLLDSLKPSVLRVTLNILGYAWLDPWVNPKTRRSNACVNEAVDDVMSNARSQTSDNSRCKSVLELLFHAKDAESGTLSPVELRDEAKTFLLAGHETTSTWCYWAFFALAKYPDIQQLVFDDIIKHAPVGTTIDLERVDKMTYFFAFLKEVLRLYPPVGLLLRHTSREETFLGHTIPANTRLVIAPHLLHRHAGYWPDPLLFCPERWLDDTPKHAFCYLPFSAGARNCIGQRFATMEAQLMLVPIIRQFEIDIAPSLRHVEFTFTTFVTMKAKPELKVCLRSRGVSS
jgi:cytochrome P450